MSQVPLGRVVWITGLPASGKTALAEALLAELVARGVVTLWLDSDDLRSFLTPHPQYTPEERDVFYGAVGHLAFLGASGGALVVVSATAPRQAYRDDVRVRTQGFIEVYLHCDESTRRARDFKGLYERYDNKEISSLPGLGAVYEPPENPEVSLSAAVGTPKEWADRVLAALDAALVSEGEPLSARVGACEHPPILSKERM